jgi:hypothetical protein
MPWGIAASVAGAAVSSKMGSKGGGGQTASKEPWAEAAPWLKDNIAQGQFLQGQYQQEPLSADQRFQYSNQFMNSDDQRNFVRSILGQMNQRQGFDRNNSGARPMPYQMPQLTSRGSWLDSVRAGDINPFHAAVMRAPLPTPAPTAAPAVANPYGNMTWDQIQQMNGGGD